MMAKRKTPMFLYHGGKDDLHPLKHVNMTYEELANEIYPGKWETYMNYYTETNLDHALSDKEIEQLDKFLKKR